MSKMKTHKGTAKRFKLTGTGKVRRRKANTNHILEKKSPKRKRQLRQGGEVSKADTPGIIKQLGR